MWLTPQGNPPDTKGQPQLKSSDPMRTVEWHTFVHPHIAKVVDPLKKLVQSRNSDGGSISISKLLELDGKTVKDSCPRVEATDGKRKGLCWNWIMGRCPRGEKCNHVHAHSKDLPEKLVTTFTTLISPLVAKKMEKINANTGNKRAKIGKDGLGVSVKFS